MATSTVTAAAASSIFNKVSDLLFINSPIPISVHFPSKPRIRKLVKVSAEFPYFPSSSVSFLQLCGASAGFDSSYEFGGEDEEEITSEQEYDDGDDEEEEKERKVFESNDGGRLYVGNLPYSMTSSQLAEVFGEAGKVISAEIVYDRVTDRSRGFAFVTMGSFDEAKEAIRMFEGSQVGGRTVKVNFPEVPRGGEREVMGPKIRSSYRGFVDSPHKIYAGNLGWRLTSEGLTDVFKNQPGLLSAKVIYERDTGRSRGFGFVTFESAEDAQSALNAMNEVEVEGRPMRLNMAAQRAQPAVPERDREEMFSSIST